MIKVNVYGKNDKKRELLLKEIADNHPFVFNSQEKCVVYILMVGVYVLFEKLLIINYRPVLTNGDLEASFPSSHTLFAVTIALTVIMTLPKYIKSLVVRLLLSAVLVVMVYVTMNGRIAGGVHWVSDVIGGVFYGAFLASVYYALMAVKDNKRIED